MVDFIVGYLKLSMGVLAAKHDDVAVRREMDNMETEGSMVRRPWQEINLLIYLPER